MLKKLYLLLFLFGLLATATAQVQLVGHINDQYGKPFNGSLRVSLARASALNTCTSPAGIVSNTQVSIPVINGVVTSSASFVPTYCLVPAVPYYLSQVTSNNVVIGNANWYFMPNAAGQMDVGTMSVANFGGPIQVAVPSPIVANPSGSQTITQPTGTTFNIVGMLSTSNISFTSVAPTGACAVLNTWTFSADGHITFCNGSSWIAKL